MPKACLSLGKKKGTKQNISSFFSPRARVLFILKKQHAKNENKKKNNTTLRHIISTTRRHNGSFKTENDRHV